MSAPAAPSEAVKVVQLLLGTLGGFLSLGFCFYFFWSISWIIPAVLALGTLPWPPTRRIGIGFAAAAVGTFVGVTVLMSITPGAYEVTPPSTPAPNPAAGSVTGDSPAWLPGDTSFARL